MWATAEPRVRCEAVTGPRHSGAASTVHSHLGPKKGKPAGIPPPANQRRNEIMHHLIFLPLIVVILDVDVKVIRKIIHKVISRKTR
jgi:hypothetical protein